MHSLWTTISIRRSTKRCQTTPTARVLWNLIVLLSAHFKKRFWVSTWKRAIQSLPGSRRCLFLRLTRVFITEDRPILWHLVRKLGRASTLSLWSFTYSSVWVTSTMCTASPSTPSLTANAQILSRTALSSSLSSPMRASFLSHLVSSCLTRFLTLILDLLAETMTLGRQKPTRLTTQQRLSWWPTIPRRATIPPMALSYLMLTLSRSRTTGASIRNSAFSWSTLWWSLTAVSRNQQVASRMSNIPLLNLTRRLLWTRFMLWTSRRTICFFTFISPQDWRMPLSAITLTCLTLTDKCPLVINTWSRTFMPLSKYLGCRQTPRLPMWPSTLSTISSRWSTASGRRLATSSLTMSPIIIVTSTSTRVESLLQHNLIRHTLTTRVWWLSPSTLCTATLSIWTLELLLTLSPRLLESASAFGSLGSSCSTHACAALLTRTSSTKWSKRLQEVAQASSWKALVDLQTTTSKTWRWD